jgi:hypothetical protein
MEDEEITLKENIKKKSFIISGFLCSFIISTIILFIILLFTFFIIINFKIVEGYGDNYCTKTYKCTEDFNLYYQTIQNIIIPSRNYRKQQLTIRYLFTRPDKYQRSKKRNV